MSTIQVRITNDDKKAAQEALEAIGMDIPTAVRVFLKKVAQVRGIPFQLTIEPQLDENGLTQEQIKEILQAEKEAEMGVNISPTFNNMDDAIKFLNSQNKEDDEN